MNLEEAVKQFRFRYEMDENASSLMGMALFAYAVAISKNELMVAAPTTKRHVLVLGREISVELDEYRMKTPGWTPDIPPDQIKHLSESPILSNHAWKPEPDRQVLTAPRIAVLINSREDLGQLIAPYISIAACMDAN